MPLVETGPGYISPSSGGYSAPGAAPTAPAAPAAPVLPTAPALPAAPGPAPMPQDRFTGGYAPIPAPSAPIQPQSATVTVKSFFSNLWDQFIGPMVKGIWNFISGLFGGGARTASATLPTR